MAGRGHTLSLPKFVDSPLKRALDQLDLEIEYCLDCKTNQLCTKHAVYFTEIQAKLGDELDWIASIAEISVNPMIVYVNLVLKLEKN